MVRYRGLKWKLILIASILITNLGKSARFTWKATKNNGPAYFGVIFWKFVYSQGLIQVGVGVAKGSGDVRSGEPPPPLISSF